MCVDVYSLHRRLFAVPMPPTSSGALILDLLNLDFAEDPDVYVNGAGPLRLHEEVDLNTGACIQLVDGGDAPAPQRTLEDILWSGSQWGSPPAFPVPRPRHRFGLVDVQGCRAFDLPPACASEPRDAIAELIGCHPRELLLTVARPRPTNVSIGGRDCHVLVSALAIGGLAITQRPVAAFVDARRLFRGWVPVLTNDGWLDTHPLIRMLLTDVPVGWRVGLAGLPLDIRWVNIEEGQTLIANCQQDAPSPTAMPSTGDSDHTDFSGYPSATESEGPPGTSRRHGGSEGGGPRPARSPAGRSTPPAWAARCSEPQTRDQPAGPSPSADPTSSQRSWGASLRGQSSLHWACVPKCMWRKDVHLATVLPVDTSGVTPACRHSARCIYNSGCLGLLSPRQHHSACPTVALLIVVLVCLRLAQWGWLSTLTWAQACYEQFVDRLPYSDTIPPQAGPVLWLCILAALGRDRGRRDICVTLAILLLLGAQTPIVLAVQIPGVPTHCAGVRQLDSSLSTAAAPPSGLTEWSVIPTPCRNRAAGLAVGRHCLLSRAGSADDDATDLDSYLRDVEISHTLLSEAARADTNWAFLAATLLDTLCEVTYQQQPHPSEGPRHLEPVRPLRLAQHVPAFSVHDLTHVSFAPGCDIDQAALLVRPGMWPLREVAGSALQGRACALGLQCAAFHERAWESLHVYTDGSFDSCTSSWAFAVIGEHMGSQFLLGWEGGQVEINPGHVHHVGAQGHSALIGEQSALAWALAWAMQAPPSLPILFFADCQVALRQATGRYGTSSQLGIASVCRALHQALHAAHPHLSPNISHVRSHAGHPPNEFVDTVAKLVCGTPPTLQSCCTHMQRIANWCRSPQLPWLWLSFASISSPAAWPTPTGCGFTDRHRRASIEVPSEKTCRTYFGLAPEAADTAPICRIQAQLCIFTLNVQSLADPAADTVESCPFPGRAAFLREQFDHHGAHVVALQEARARTDGMFVSATHVRLCSGKDPQGNFGVELWFSRLHPFAYLGPTALYFVPSDLLVLHADPRELFVRYCRGSLHILFVSLHAPGATHTDRQTWWSSFRARLDRFARGNDVVLLGDFNTHFAEALDDLVGDLVFPSRHTVPPALQSLLRRQALWVPSTFSSCHPGPSATWWPPTGGPGARLDYAAIPRHWQVPLAGSTVFSSLDWGQARDDHHALRTWVSFADFGHRGSMARRPAYDREAMLTESGRNTLQYIFASAPVVPWAQNVHQHFSDLQQHLVDSLATAFPAAKSGCRSSHFSPYTWQLRQKRVWLRRHILALRPVVTLLDVRCAFVAWCRSRSLGTSCVIQALCCGRQVCDLAQCTHEIACTKKALRGAIRADVGARISDAAKDAAMSATGDVVSRLQCLLGPSKRRARPTKGLPGILKPDGNPAETPAEVEETWIQHFSQIEAGRPCTPRDLVLSCMRTQLGRDLTALEILPADVPTLAELEGAFRQTMLHRAFGTDGIPAEALQAAPGAAARAFYPLLIKCALRIEEPIQFKGGSLFAVWKGKLSQKYCEAHRGILVSSVVGKAYHRLLRGRNVTALGRVASPLQLGGLPKRPVTLAAQVIRLHQAWCKDGHRSHATVFLDLREAFYRILRPLVTGFRGTDEEVAHVLKAVRLPGDTMHELRLHLQQCSLLRQAGATQWTDLATCEALQHTWFRFEQGSSVTETGIGTRPGDNLADLIFSFVFARVLHQVREQVDRAIGLTRLPWHGDMLNQPYPVASTERSSLPLLDCTWMDDSALVVGAASAADLPQRLCVVISALLDSCLGRALLPNLDRGKTEAVVSLTGPASRSVRSELFRHDPPTLKAESRLWPTARVKLVAAYKHLGGVIHHSGALKRELSHRIALAWSAFNKRRKKVFASPFVARADKVALLDSLVLSVLLYGAGTWRSLSRAEHQCLANALHQMAFSMLRPLYAAEEARHVGAQRALALLGLPSIDTLLHLARLRHLQSCVVVGVAEFWALAHAEGHWLRSVRESLAWLAELVGPSEGSSEAHTSWTAWQRTMCRFPGKWKRLLRQAQGKALRREAWVSAASYHQGLLSRQLRFAGAVLTGDRPEAWDARQCCAPCGKIFPTLQAWSVHAFKVHGRLATGRGILQGYRCECCLRQFGTNVKLCKHLAYSTDCRLRLQSAGYACDAEPGQGNSRAEDAGQHQLPAVQAAGPALPLGAKSWLSETDRPIAEILEAVQHIIFDGPLVARQTLWSRARTAFGCVCAPVGRLRATATACLHLLEERDTDAHLPIHGAIGDILRWIADADLVEWLVPVAAVDAPSLHTFRDCDLLLHTLEVAAIRFPEPNTGPDCAFLGVGPTPWCQSWTLLPNVICYDMEECLRITADGGPLPFLAGPFEDVAFVFALDTWRGFRNPSPHCTPARACLASLARETLQSDLVRFALKLWGLGVPACLLFCSASLPFLAPLPELDCLESGQAGHGRFLRNHWEAWSATCFVSL